MTQPIEITITRNERGYDAALLAVKKVRARIPEATLRVLDGLARN